MSNIEQIVDLLNQGQDVCVIAKGNSMLPFIREGKDRILLRREDKFEVGDIVMAQVPPGRYVIHRLIDITGDELTLKGDGNYNGVEKCRREDVVGVVGGIIRPNNKVRFPSVGENWHKLPLFIRRPIIAVYRRIIK